METFYFHQNEKSFFIFREAVRRVSALYYIGVKHIVFDVCMCATVPINFSRTPKDGQNFMAITF
jgi:hypothetical protein